MSETRLCGARDRLTGEHVCVLAAGHAGNEHLDAEGWAWIAARPPPSERDCMHGSLRRACEVCDLGAQVESQAREIERLKGRLARVLRYAHGYFGHMGTGVWSRRRSVKGESR
jgi:hypothetical protein